jgi:RimJ/RimL family protein N-acetyltransferase
MVEFKNIGIRAIEIDDLIVIQKWRNDENLRQYFREYREFSMSQIKEWYLKMLNDNKFEMFVIVDLNSGEVVGVTGITYIDWVNRHADVHFYIGKSSSWIDEEYSPIAFKLILSYGFNVLNLNKLWAEIYEIDLKKLTFFKSKGFEVDATLRDHYYYNGKYYNSHLLSLLKSDYENE